MSSQMEEGILKILKEKGDMTTSEIEDNFRAEGIDCPDGAAKTLMRLKGQGRVLGRIDRERRGWVWSAV